MSARPMSCVTTTSSGVSSDTMAKSAESAPTPTWSTRTQNPRSGWRGSRGSRGSVARTERSRFCVEFPAITQEIRSSRATASASRVTGHASASM